MRFHAKATQPGGFCFYSRRFLSVLCFFCMNPRDILQRCPFCQTAYADAAVQALVQRPEAPAAMYHCACDRCKKAVMAFVHEQGPWLSSVGMFTELNAQEARQIGRLAPVSGDLCVQVHRVLEGSSQEFCRFLLKQT